MRPTPINDSIEGVIGAERHASSPSPSRRRPGGEWDAWHALPNLSRRRLIGARWARHGGMQPDVFADLIAVNTGLDDYRTALEWFYTTALLAVDERRSAHNHNTHLAIAQRHGLPTYYAYRNLQAQFNGHTSLWHLRQERGWARPRRAPWKPQMSDAA